MAGLRYLLVLASLAAASWFLFLVVQSANKVTLVVEPQQPFPERASAVYSACSRTPGFTMTAVAFLPAAWLLWGTHWDQEVVWESDG